MVLILCLYFLAQKYFIPSHFIPVTYTIIAHFLIAGLQSKKIDELVHQGTKIFSGWRVTLITIVSAAITGSFIFGMELLEQNKNEILYNNYVFGTKKHVLRFESGELRPGEADSLGRALQQINYFDEPEIESPKPDSRAVTIGGLNIRMRYNMQPKISITKTVRVKKVEGNYELFINSMEYQNTGISEMNSYFDYVRKDLQELYPHHKIIINLTDDTEQYVLYKIG